MHLILLLQYVAIIYNSGFQIKELNYKLIFLYLNQNICCGYSKEPYQRDSSSVHKKPVEAPQGGVCAPLIPENNALISPDPWK